METFFCQVCGAPLDSSQTHFCPACTDSRREDATLVTPLPLETIPPTLRTIKSDSDEPEPDSVPTRWNVPKTAEGEVLGGYHRLLKIGSWRFGSIYSGEDRALQRAVRLIVLEAPWNQEHVLRDWFLSHARAAAKVRHPHLESSVLEASETKAAVFMAIGVGERCSTELLAKLARQADPRLSVDPVPHAFLGVFAALRTLHEHGIIHGQIAPPHLAFQGQQFVLKLYPFETGMPGESLIFENGQPRRLESIAVEEDYRDLARAYVRVLLGPETTTEIPSHPSARWLIRRFPLVQKPFAKLLARIASRGVKATSIDKRMQTLHELAHRRLVAASWGDRFGTLGYDAIFYGLAATLLFICAQLVEFWFYSLNDFLSATLGISAPLTVATQLLWAVYYLVFWEACHRTTPGRGIRGLFLIGANGHPTTLVQRLARSMIRVAWVFGGTAFFTILGFALLVASGLGPLEASWDQWQWLWTIPLWFLLATLMLYGTSVFFRGIPLHDKLSRIRLVRYLLVHSSAGTKSRLRQGIKGALPANPPPEDPLASPSPTPSGSSPATTPHGLLGEQTKKQVDQYRLENELGRGGMGAVYKGWDETLNRPVALKIIASGGSDAREAVARFEREAQLSAKLDHRNIAKIYGVGVWRNQPYMAMEFVAGDTLQDIVKKEGPLPAAQAWEIVQQAAYGLQEAARQGIVHRDIKPSNLMLADDGTVKLLDFGISKLLSEQQATTITLETIVPLPDDRPISLTRTGALLGTPQYMSPEQTRGEPLDARSDIYSLGLTLYYLLAGRPAFDSQSYLELLMRQGADPPPPLDRTLLKPAQQSVLDRMLAKAPQDRFQDYPSLIESLAHTAPLAPRLASISDRLLASLIDVVLGIVLLWGSRLFLNTMSFLDADATDRSAESFAPLIELLTSLVPSALLVIPMLKSQTTFGKWLLNLKVDSLTHHRLTKRQVFLRFIAQWPLAAWSVALSAIGVFYNYSTISWFVYFVLPLLPFVQMGLWALSVILMMTLAGQPAIHDLIAKTRVLKLSK